jgi:ribosome-binding factor A
MAQGYRPDRLADQIRSEITALLAREVHDPGVGFLTITRVKVTTDLQIAHIFYTMMGDEAARTQTTKALDRVLPFLRRQLAGRLRLRRVPELHFRFDKSIEHQDRVERLIHDIQTERAARAEDAATNEPEAPETHDTSD